MSWEVDETLNATARPDLDRVAANLEGQKNRDQAKWVISFAKAALNNPLPSAGSSGPGLGRDNDTYHVVASGDGESYFTVSVERVF